MKNLLKVALVAFCMVFMGNLAKAQTQKIGYIDMDAAIMSLPEVKTVKTQLDAFAKTWQDNLTTLQTELQTKAKEYDAKKATMTDAARTLKEQELNDINNRLTQNNQLASQQVEAKQGELSKPLIEKVNAAISAVAKEKGYTYVINTTQNPLLVAPDADNLLAAVKLKLGIK